MVLGDLTPVQELMGVEEDVARAGERLSVENSS